jgi:transforming growth factor-beta-induced protein
MFNNLQRLGVAGLVAIALPLGMAACDSDSDVTTPVQDLDIVQTAIEAGTFETLVTAVQAAGLTSTLQGAGPFTVFAPTDAAFDDLPAGTLDALLADTGALTEVLLYHVVPGRILASDLEDGQIVTTAEGRPFRVTLSGGARVNGVNVIQTDVEATNGVIHIIDAVLIPVEDNVDTAIDAGFNTLVAAVQAAELEAVLRSAGPFTIFAPTDEAFDALPEGALEDLLNDPEALATILTYHVVAGRLFASDLSNGMELTTVEGRTVTVSLNGGAQVNAANIVATDVFTSNGVIHVIDAVLIPEDED